MNLRDFFAQNNGTAILATAGREGQVDAAIYSKPHIVEEDTIALLMSDRLSHANIQENPYACYLFKQEGPGWQGVRLYLRKISEERNTELAQSLIRRNIEDRNVDVNLVYFEVEKVLPLVGS